MSRVGVADYTFPDLAQEQAAAGNDFQAFQCRTAEDVAAAVAGADVAVVQFAPFGPAVAAAIRPGATVIRISLHAPATAETTGFFNTERLFRMQRHAMIVNSARGQLIVEEDLADALACGVIAGAALDVFPVEPLVADSPLRNAPNLLLTVSLRRGRWACGLGCFSKSMAAIRAAATHAGSACGTEHLPARFAGRCGSAWR